MWQGKTILYAEEGVWLAERGMLAVRPPLPLRESGNTELSPVERPDGPVPAASATRGPGRAPATLSRKLATSTQSRESGESPPPTEADSTTVEESSFWTRKAGKAPRLGHGKYRDRDFSFSDKKNVRTMAQFLSTGALFGVLPRAGVSWECYRAYAELKRRQDCCRSCRNSRGSREFIRRDKRRVCATAAYRCCPQNWWDILIFFNCLAVDGTILTHPFPLREHYIILN